MGRWTTKKKFLVFWSLAKNTNPLKFYKEGLYFHLRGQKGTGHSKANEWFWYENLLLWVCTEKKKRRLGGNEGGTTEHSIKSLCLSFQVLQVLCLSECSQKNTSFSSPSPFPLKSWSLHIRLGMCLSVFLFFSLKHSKTELNFAEKQLINSWTSRVLISLGRFQDTLNLFYFLKK